MMVLVETDGAGGTANQHPSVELEGEQAQRVSGPDQPGPAAPQVKTKERQKYFEEAFQQDMEQYLSTGYLQIERREPIGSMSSMEVNVDMLEQMDLMDMSDHESLDVFLHSGGEDSATSPVTEPDMESFTTEISLQVPTQAELRHKLSSLSSTCTDSASQDTEAGEDEDQDEDQEQGEGPSRGRLPLAITNEGHAHTVVLGGATEALQIRKDCGERSS